MKKIVNYVVLAIVTILVLFFALKDNFNETIHQLLTMKLSWLIVAFLMVIIFWFLRSWAIHIFSKQIKKDYKYSNSLLLTMRTQFMNAITPFATGGQPYQVYFLNKCGIKPDVGTGIIVQNFIVYQIALVLLGLIALFSNYILGIFPKNHLLAKLIVLGFIINTIVIIVLFIVSFAKKINKKIINITIRLLTKLKIIKDKEKTLANWNEYINNFHENAKILLKDKKMFLFTILLNFIALICLYSVPLFVLYAMGDMSSVNAFEAVITSAYVMLIGSFVPIPGGTGGLEFGFSQFYGFFVKGSVLSAAMLIWRFITYYFGLIAGAIAMNIKRVK
jgi:uncharacterized protein (TIRG00374 family)